MKIRIALTAAAIIFAIGAPVARAQMQGMGHAKNDRDDDARAE